MNEKNKSSELFEASPGSPETGLISRLRSLLRDLLNFFSIQKKITGHNTLPKGVKLKKQEACGVHPSMEPVFKHSSTSVLPPQVQKKRDELTKIADEVAVHVRNKPMAEVLKEGFSFPRLKR